MDNSHDDATLKTCPGSGSAGVKHTNITESGREVVYYECPTCGVLLPYAPLKDHSRGGVRVGP